MSEEAKQTEETVEFHVHALMELIASAPRALSLNEIERVIVECFPKNSRFSSCSVIGMDGPQVLQFMLSKGKLAEVEPGYYKLAACGTCGGH